MIEVTTLDAGNNVVVAGDRVYCCDEPRIEGTVVDCLSPDEAVVLWDHHPDFGFTHTRATEGGSEFRLIS